MGRPGPSEKMKQFVREYLGEAKLNATEAARRAGYKPDNADITASDLMQHPWVKAEVEKGMKERAAKTGVTAERVLQELERIALADPLDAYDEQGLPRPLKDMPEGLRRTISQIDTETSVSEDGVTTTVRKIRFWDKSKSLELFLRHMGMLQDKSRVELSGKDGEALQVVVRVYGEGEDK